MIDKSKYDEQAELARYVFRNLRHKFTPFEDRVEKADYARRNFSGATDGYGVHIMERYSRLSDSAVNKVIDEGIDAFRKTVCERILDVHPELIIRCPKCVRIVRTPRAEQCFWCGHDWHH